MDDFCIKIHRRTERGKTPPFLPLLVNKRRGKKAELNEETKWQDYAFRETRIKHSNPTRKHIHGTSKQTF